MSIAIAVAPPAEQSEIVEHFMEQTAPLRNAIARTEREIILLREYRTRLIADVVTGKLDVRVVAAQLPAETKVPELLTDAGTLAEGDEENEGVGFDAATEDEA